MLTHVLTLYAIYSYFVHICSCTYAYIYNLYLLQPCTRSHTHTYIIGSTVSIVSPHILKLGIVYGQFLEKLHHQIHVCHLPTNHTHHFMEGGCGIRYDRTDTEKGDSEVERHGENRCGEVWIREEFQKELEEGGERSVPCPPWKPNRWLWYATVDNCLCSVTWPHLSHPVAIGNPTSFSPGHHDACEVEDVGEMAREGLRPCLLPLLV